MSIVGRQLELTALEDAIVQEGQRILVICGPSGIGKTKLVESFCDSHSVAVRFEQTIFLTMYRSNWTTALSQLKRNLPDVPANATRDELEAAAMQLASSSRILLVLDNVEADNVADVISFTRLWLSSAHSSALILTAQDEVQAILPNVWPTLRLRGLTAEEDVLTLLGGLRASLPLDELMRVSETLEGNPQLLLFLRWLEPKSVAALQESTAKLADRKTIDAVEDLIGHSSLSALFFLALGVHKDLDITEELLANLWDHFGSRGAEPFVRAIAMLTRRGFLTPTKPGHYRLHESVHVNLPKALRYRIGEERIPSLHHYFAEYYRRWLYQNPSNVALTHFVYHARLAGDYRLIYDTLIARGVATKLASLGTALQVRAELEQFASGLADNVLLPSEHARLYIVLGRLCNDLSEHWQALEYMKVCEEHMAAITEPTIYGDLAREIWYISAVAHSNTGQSDSCLQNYFRIVDSCSGDSDDLACLAAGYLAHDLKYRDIRTAASLGELSVEWARSFDSGTILAKNLCSYAETIAILKQPDYAGRLFQEAEAIAKSLGNQRELARIWTNWGFSEAINGRLDSLDKVDEGTELSRVLGDRRRHWQGMLYGGLRLCLRKERVRGRSAISRSALGFQSLDDGRYFVLALCWLLQLDGITLEDRWTLTIPPTARHDVAALLDYALEHPEFEVYFQFWKANLSSLIGDLSNVGEEPRK